MAPQKGNKRVREDDLAESFWEEEEDSGVYLTIKLLSGRTLKEKGWPWVQQSIRGILGGKDKVGKASFLTDGRLLVKTKDPGQTEKLLRTKKLGDEECEVERDQKLNQSRGTIHAYDLLDLSEEEVVGWLTEFGVVAAKRFMRKVGNHFEKTPTILLTFDRPTVPTKLQFDYVVYRVKKHVPNPLLCHNCGKFGHTRDRCRSEGVCLTCGESKHEGACEQKCINCGHSDHDCFSRRCSIWKREKEICELKVDRDVSYPHARRLYEQEHRTPIVRPFATAVRTHSETPGDDVALRNKVDSLEQKLDKVVTLLLKLLEQNKSTTKDQQLVTELTPVVGGREPQATANVCSPDADMTQVTVEQQKDDQDLDIDNTASPDPELTSSQLSTLSDSEQQMYALACAEQVTVTPADPCPSVDQRGEWSQPSMETNDPSPGPRRPRGRQRGCSGHPGLTPASGSAGTLSSVTPSELNPQQMPPPIKEKRMPSLTRMAPSSTP